MQVENATLITKTNSLQFQDRKHNIADDVENTSIAFRILNKHHRVRLSSNEFDYGSFPRKTNLFAVSNSKGCFVAAIKQQNDFCLICSSLKDLRNSFKSGQSSSSPFIPIQSQSSHTKLSGTPCNVKIAMNDERVLVGMLDGSVIIYDLNQLFENESQSDPNFVIPTRSPTPVADILPNRGENSELVAILHGPIDEKQGYQIEIFNLKECNSLVTWHGGEDPNIIPTSISWSPKGKQIAIGLHSGDILLFNPHDPTVPKNYILKSTSVLDSASSVLSISWLATNIFYLVFSSPESCFPSFDRELARDVSKTHVILAYEPKSRTALDIEVSEPSPPFGASFPPGPLCCIIKDWPPTKFLLICGDGPSSDIGVLGSTSDKNWNHYTFEETSTPTLPLGEGAEDMVLLGLDVDLTSDEPVRISEQPDDGTPDLPPSPILYAYMSDGSVVAWHILYLDGTPFPGMVKSTQAISDSSMLSSPVSSPMQQSSKQIPLSGDAAQTSMTAPAKGFGIFLNQQPSISSLANTGPETTSTNHLPAGGTQAATQTGSGLGNRPPAPTFGVAGWGFGSKPTAPTGLGHKGEVSAAPVFGQSGFAGFSSNPPKPTSVFSGGGFAAFAQTGASSFGNPVGTTTTSIFDQPSDPSAQFTTTSPKSVFGVGGVGLAPSMGSQKTIFGVKPSDVSNSNFGSRITDATSLSSSFGTKSAVPGTTSSFKPSDRNTHGFDTQGVRALDTMSSLAGSLDATAGSPPGSPPPMEESPPNSPPSRSTDLPKPMSSYFKPATAFGTPPATSTEPKPMSPFIKPGFGAFGSSAENSTVISPFKPATGFGKYTGLPENKAENKAETKPAASAFTTAKSSHSAIPVFGVSGFGQVPKASASTEPSTPVSGGFSAFASGGFASFAKPPKASSFDELLNQGDLKTTKSPLVFGSSSKLESPDSDGGLAGKLAATRTESTEKDKKGDGDEKEKNISVATGGTADNSFSLAALSEAVKITVAIEKEKDSPTVQERPVIEEAKSPIQRTEVKTEPSFTNVVSKQEKVAEETKPLQSPISKVPELSTPMLAPQPVTPSVAAATGFPIPGASSITVVSGGGAERPVSSLFAPKPTLSPAPQTPSAAGIGLGRPSSRPARSSPLAGAPITLGESTTTVPLQDNPTPPSHTPSLSVPSSQSGLSSQKPLDLSDNTSKTAEISKPSIFGKPVPAPLTSKPPNPVVTPSTLSIPVKFSEEQLKPKESRDVGQHPLQLEFIRIYEDFCNELKDLEKGLEALKALFPVIQVPRGLDKLVPNNEEFVPGKYSFGDLNPFKILISRLHEKVLPLLDEVKSGKLRLTELQNLALISETRLEELSRWATAKDDPDFAKTLKPKLLGPEHTENQLRLRKLLQNTLLRLQQCEDIIEALQKKLNQEKKGNAGFQAPTLDTIDRTCRNIKVALDERTDIVDKLSERVEALSPRRKTRPPVMGANLSPPFPAPAASIAVAALNSERFCLSLKNALFNARQRPLFTDNVTKASSAAKSSNPDTTPIPERSFSSPLYNNTITTAPESGSDSFLSSHESVDRRRQNRKHTSIAVPFKNNPGEEAKVPTFNWGPLPKVVSTPPKKLPFEFKTSAKDATSM